MVGEGGREGGREEGREGGRGRERGIYLFAWAVFRFVVYLGLCISSMVREGGREGGK